MLQANLSTVLDGSWDRLIHELSKSRNSLLIFREYSTKEFNEKRQLIAEEVKEEIRTKSKMGQRAIGVVYNPEYEKYGNYVPTDLIRRYDAFRYIDKTHALHLLHMPEVKEDKDLPETFPTGL